jgi:hypothetical protein
MASSYTGLGTELMTTGENAGTWGSTTNTNLQIIEQISGGYVEQAISSTTTTLSVSDGSTGATLGHRIIKFTGTLSGNSTVTIPLDVQQMYILVNGTSGTYTLTFKYVSGSGSTVAFGTTDKGTKIVYAAADDSTDPNMVDTGISTNTLTGVTGDITIDSPDDIVLDAAGGNIEFKDAGTTQLTLDMDTTANVQIIKLGVNSDDLVFQQYDGNEVVRIADDRRLYFYDKGGEYIYGDGTDLHITSGADINIPANIGLTFGDDGEKIEGDGTDLTISGNNINLTGTADVNIPSGVGLTFATTEKIESDGTDLSITVGSNGDINVPANIGVTFGDDGEKIEGDGTDLTISGNNINLTATADVVIPANVGITFGTGEKIEGDSTDLTVTSGAKINLTATSDVIIPSGVGLILDGSGNEKIESDGTDISISVGSGGDINIPSSIGMTFGDDGEKIEGDGTDLTITGNTINLTATTDVVLAANTGLVLDGSGNEKIESDGTDISISVGSSGDINVPASIGVTFGDDGEKIEGDGTDLTIASSGVLNLAAGGTTNQIKVTDGAILPITDDDVDLGSSSYQFKDAYFDGTVEADAITIGGSAIVSSPITALNNATANELVTVGATTTELEAEANLTFDGTDVLLGGAGKLQLRDTGLYVASNADGDLDVVSDGTAVDSINLESAGGITLDAGTASSGIIYEDDGTEMLRVHNSSSDVIVESKVQDKDIIFKVNDGGSATEVARFDGDVSAFLIASGKKLMIGAAEEYISGDGTDISFTVGSGGDINIGSGIGVTFGDDGEKIEGDGTDLTIASSAALNLTATTDVVIPANVGITFGSGEKIEGDSTDLTVTSGGAINLTATTDVVIPNSVGIQFGGASEKIEGDGTDLTISANNLTVDAAADIILDAAGNNVTFKSGGTAILDISNSSSDAVITSSVQDKDIIFKGDDGGSAVTALTLDMSAGGIATFGAAANVAQQAITSSSNAVAWDASDKPNAYHQTTENTTLSAPTNAVEGAFICIEINFNGSHTFAWNAIFNFAADAAPTTTDTDGKTDILVFRYNGAIWQEVGRTLNIPES